MNKEPFHDGLPKFCDDWACPDLDWSLLEHYDFEISMSKDGSLFKLFLFVLLGNHLDYGRRTSGIATNTHGECWTRPHAGQANSGK